MGCFRTAVFPRYPPNNLLGFIMLTSSHLVGLDRAFHHEDCASAGYEIVEQCHSSQDYRRVLPSVAARCYSKTKPIERRACSHHILNALSTSTRTWTARSQPAIATSHYLTHFRVKPKLRIAPPRSTKRPTCSIPLTRGVPPSPDSVDLII